MNLLHYREECLSTNDEIESFLLYSEEDFQGVYTFNQTQGRGQYGNQWKTTPNLNIAFTIAVNTNLISLQDSLFNYYTANSIRDFLANMSEFDVKIKWPNDIIIKNKKVGGILIEKRKFGNQHYFVIGFGLNVLQDDFLEISNAGSLLTQTLKKFDLHEISKNLFEYLIRANQNLELENNIIKNYNHHLFRKGEISVFEKNNKKQNGIIQKADENGELWIDLEEEGLQKFYHKEIKLLY